MHQISQHHRHYCSYSHHLLSSVYHSFIHSFIPLACAECDDSLPFSGAFPIPLCYIPLSSTLFHQLVFHPPALHLAIYFLVYLSALLLPNSYIILYSVHKSVFQKYELILASSVSQQQCIEHKNNEYSYLQSKFVSLFYLITLDIL